MNKFAWYESKKLIVFAVALVAFLSWEDGGFWPAVNEVAVMWVAAAYMIGQGLADMGRGRREAP